MARRSHRFSIFSQSLDRVSFVAYLLGAVVPLFALAYVAQVYALPKLDDVRATAGLVGLVISIAALSLASFLVLRRTASQALAKMDSDNHMLLAILSASRSLSLAPHRAEAGQTLVTCAREITSAPAAFVLACEAEKLEQEQRFSFQVIAQIGEDSAETYVAYCSAIEEVAQLAIESGEPVVRSDGDELGLVSLPVRCDQDPLGVLVVPRPGVPEGATDSELDALSTLCSLGAVALHSAELQDTQRNFFVQLTDVLIGALDTHRDYHQGHARRVAYLSNEIGRELGFDHDRRERLHFAALLHDIGMLKIPPARHEETKTVQKHPEIGHRILNAIRLWEDLAPLVLHHHEWFGGRGYPEGLAGDEIPLESRIIGLAEAVDSMISRSSYRPARSVEEMVREVERSTPDQFDPEVVRAFIDLVERGALTFD